MFFRTNSSRWSAGRVMPGDTFSIVPVEEVCANSHCPSSLTSLISGVATTFRSWNMPRSAPRITSRPARVSNSSAIKAPSGVKVSAAASASPLLIASKYACTTVTGVAIRTYLHPVKRMARRYRDEWGCGCAVRHNHDPLVLPELIAEIRPGGPPGCPNSRPALGRRSPPGRSRTLLGPILAPPPEVQIPRPPLRVGVEEQRLQVLAGKVELNRDGVVVDRLELAGLGGGSSPPRSTTGGSEPRCVRSRPAPRPFARSRQTLVTIARRRRTRRSKRSAGLHRPSSPADDP